LSSPSDPIRSLRIARNALDAVLVVAVVVAIGWAVRPIREVDPTDHAREDAPAMTQTGVPSDGFPVAAFDRTLWYVPPTPVVVM